MLLLTHKRFTSLVSSCKTSRPSEGLGPKNSTLTFIRPTLVFLSFKTSIFNPIMVKPGSGRSFTNLRIIINRPSSTPLLSFDCTTLRPGRCFRSPGRVLLLRPRAQFRILKLYHCRLVIWFVPREDRPPGYPWILPPV